MRAPALENYVLYVKAGTRPDLRENLAGIWVGGKVTPFKNTAFDPDKDIVIDDSNVNYSVSGMYTAFYRLSQVDRYGARTELGSADLMVIVED
jgi:hypothetical protein